MATTRTAEARGSARSASSVLGQFLEHSRAFSFEVDDDERMFIGSADSDATQPRSSGRGARPTRGPARARRGALGFDLLLEDNTQAWELTHDGAWDVRRAGRGRRGTHGRLISRARARARRSAAP